MNIGTDEVGGYWIETANHAGCYLRDLHPRRQETVTWSGSCTDGKASGTGEKVRRSRDKESGWCIVENGVLVGGMKQGHWVERYAEGQVEEGPYVDGRRQGHWVVHCADGTVAEGPMDGKRQGHWVERFADGTVAEGPYVDDERNGAWIVCDADGQVDEGPFADGKRTGHWVQSFATGTVAEGLYVDGKRNGHWVWRYSDGTVTSTNMTGRPASGDTSTEGGMVAGIAELVGFLGLFGMFFFGFLVVAVILAFGFLSIAVGRLPDSEHLWPLWCFLTGAGVGFVLWNATWSVSEVNR